MAYAAVEGFFDKFGLMTGPNADKKRMVIGAVGTGFVLVQFKPDLFFHEGRVRPWSMLVQDPAENPTMFTLYHAMILGGFIAGVLI